MATILIVGDHVLNRQFLTVLLDSCGHRLIEANDGVEALQLACARRPDLVVADIMMPTMDGCEFVKRLRAIPSIAATPVIFHAAACHEREASLMALGGKIVQKYFGPHPDRERLTILRCPGFTLR